MSLRWEPIPEMTDEFEGERLDAAKWWDVNPHWEGRPPALFMASNVRVAGGRLMLTARAENPPPPQRPEYHTFTTAAVKSRAKALYGYFEIQCRPMKSRASSAFWFYDSTPEEWTEIDVFEMAAGDSTRLQAVFLNAHVFYTPAHKGPHLEHGTRWEMGQNVADADHRYGLLWTAKTVRWFIDGQCVKTLDNTHWHQPLHLNFDSETFPDWFGLPDPAELPATFSIEYVRAWRYTGSGSAEDEPLPESLSEGP